MRVAAAFALLAIGAAAALALRSPDDAGPPRLTTPAVRDRPADRLQDVRNAQRRGPFAALLVRRTLLRARPGGRPLRALGTRTRFGQPRVLAIVRQRGGWLAVLSEHVPNSRVGWIPRANVELRYAPYELFVDLSRRKLLVRRRGRPLRIVRVAVGRPQTPTPAGRFGVTDLLRVVGGPSPYGCCVLALTGHQPNVPQGWGGGDRIAIHGTSNEATLGTAASSGCLRASDRDMRWMLKRIPPGAPVHVHA